MKKALFIRLDKIGDLICTLPVDQVQLLRDWDVTWVIAKGLAFIPENSVPPRKFIELDKNDSVAGRKILEDYIRDFQPDVAISFQAPWWVNFALWKNHIAKRIGVTSKWHSLLFLNMGVRQKRSRAIKHEADYNLDLVRQLDPQRVIEKSAPVLRLKAPAHPELLQLHNLLSKRFMIVHPGMAGSALNWPTENYIELIKRLSINYKVVLTGTPADEPWLSEIKTGFAQDPQVLNLQSMLNPSELLYLLSEADSVFAPSTGVLHLAASLGTRVFGFYSLIRVQTQTRWAARGPDVHLFSPIAGSPDSESMRTITVDRVLKELT
ncbi:MAG: glycosyltransferase family 9 protein [Bdellovibrionaceae bacterium]|nr:glycosyltransferase family 9 protein [Pseudobdellovibrionaceae bacterium]